MAADFNTDHLRRAQELLDKAEEDYRLRQDRPGSIVNFTMAVDLASAHARVGILQQIQWIVAKAAEAMEEEQG